MKIEHEVSDTRIEDLLVCAFEGGIGYWAQLTGVEGPGSDRRVAPYAAAPVLGGRTLIRDQESGSDAPLVLDREAIQRGLSLMATKAPYSWGAFLAGDEDANVGDLFVQLAVFGEVRYG